MKCIASLLFVLVTASCVTTSVTPLTSSYYPPCDASQVQVYLSERDVPGPFEKIGLIYAKGDSSFTDQRQMIEKGRRDAAKLGANGLLVQGIDEASQGAKIAAQVFGTYTNRHGEMVAIYVHPAPSPGQRVRSGEATGTTSRSQSFEEWLESRDQQ